MTEIEIREAVWPAHRDVVARLLREYLDSLGVDLGFQHVEAEPAKLPGSYARPDGVVLIAGAAVGMVAYRPRGFQICEMKRLYIRISGRAGAAPLSAAACARR